MRAPLALLAFAPLLVLACEGFKDDEPGGEVAFDGSAPSDATLPDASDAGQARDASDGAPVADADASPPPESDAGPSDAGGDASVGILLGLSEGTSCALFPNHTVACWGTTDLGQRGLGDVDAAAYVGGQPTIVPGVDHAVAISGSGWGSHMCVVNDDGGVVCWGNNAHDQIGVPSAATPVAFSPTAVPSIAKMIDVAAGQYATCATRADRAGVTCWGIWTFTQGTGVADIGGFTSSVRAVGAGTTAECALEGAGSVVCWGDDGHGNFGFFDAGSALTPVAVPGVGPASSLAVGGDTHVCAVVADAGVVCWGADESGQAGPGGDGGDRATPAAIDAGDVVQLAAGGAHTCARRRDGTVACWGRNDYAQRGIGGDPGPINDVPGVTHATDIAAGGRHTCAVIDGTSVTCWGWNGLGQAGVGDDPAPPQTVRF